MKHLLFLSTFIITCSVFGQEEVPAPPPPKPSGTADPIFEYVEVSPEFPGGKESMKLYLLNNTVYPEAALEKGIEGKCYLKFVVSKSGTISNISVQRGVVDCPECDKEAIRVVKNMPNWKPGQNSGKAVNSWYNLSVAFKIPPIEEPISVVGGDKNIGFEAPKEVAPPPPPADEQVKVIDVIEEEAEFPGGMMALKRYIANNIVYPKSALEKGIQGKCYLKFVVTANGSVSDVNVTKGVTDCPECDQEAIRVAKGMPNWKPAKSGGKPVNSYFHLPVNFIIPPKQELQKPVINKGDPELEAPKQMEPAPPVKEEVQIYQYVDEPAEFPGGNEALKLYLANNIVYPKIALEKGIQGRCYVNFVVSESGKISNVKVVKGVPDCAECDQEIVRVVKGMPNWKPGKANGRNVHSFYTLPVSFKLPAPEKKEK